MTVERTRRWRVGLVATLALLGTGLLFAEVALLAGAAIPLSYLFYESVSRAPKPDLAATRTFQPEGPSPGERVTVSVTIENRGEQTLSDVRIIDGVPAELAVSSGTPRGGRPLSPGDELKLEYSVVARRGEYSFDEPLVRVRSLAAGERRTRTIPTEGDRTLVCANAVKEPPLDDATLFRAGTLPMDSGGNGLEFYSTRQYRSGDPINRIDWRHVAKTGDFVTVQYRKEQAARTVLVLDARPVGRVTPAPGYPTGTSLCGYAGERLFEALEGSGVVTSVTAVGFEEGDLGGLVGPDGLPWVDADVKAGQRASPAAIFTGVQEVADKNAVPLSTQAPAPGLDRNERGRSGVDGSFGISRTRLTDDIRTDGQGSGEWSGYRDSQQGDGYTDESDRENSSNRSDRVANRLIARLPPNAQVVLCTTLLDNWSVSLAQQLSAQGYKILVLTPDVLQAETPAQRVAGLYRDQRIRSIEGVGETVTWNPEQPVEYTLHHALPHLFGEK